MLLLSVTLILAPVLFLTSILGFAQNHSISRGEVNSDNINIRADSTVTSEVISKANKSDIVETVAEKYDWYKIRLPREACVYIKEELVELLDGPATSEATEDKIPLQAKVAASNVNIRLKPSLESRIIGKADYNQTVEVIEKQDGWYKISPTNSCYGWIHKKFVEPAEEIPEPVKIEEIEVDQ